MSNFSTPIAIAWVFLLGSSLAWAESPEYRAKLAREKKDKRIGKLELKPTELEVLTADESGAFDPHVKVKGTLKRKQWNLLWDKNWVLKTEEGAEAEQGARPFSFEAHLTGKETALELTAISPSGETLKET